MKINVKGIGINNQQQMTLAPVNLEQISVGVPAVISIDGSTTITGVAILRKNDGALMYSASFAREDGESPVRYKIMLKREVEKILKANPNINLALYEEPFLGYATAAANLFMLRTFLEELAIENEPELNYLERLEINNKRWKKMFLHPDKCPNNSALEKEAVKKKLLLSLPFLEGITQDEIDAISMGWTVIAQIGKENVVSTKARPFGYNVQFIGAHDDDEAFMDFSEIYKGPAIVADNGINYIQLKPRTNFEKQVYNAMGEEDKLVVARYNSDDHANITLKHRIGPMAATYPFIYAFIWRKTRKH